MTTLKQNATRAETVRKRRESQTVTPTKRSYHTSSVYLPVEPRLEKRRTARSTTTRRTGTGSRPQRYDIAFSLGRADVRAPALSIPQLGARWISMVLTLVLGFLLYSMWNGSLFKVSAAEVHGNQRLTIGEVSSMLGMVGQPIFKAIPAHIADNLRNAYPDLASVSVSIRFPNHIMVEVVERKPILAWYENGSVTWIDANGISFMPRGQVEGLIQVASNGTPPQVQTGDLITPLYETPYITPQMVLAMVTLYPYIPSGMPMIYDPQYGMGWQDPRGWTVYFGQNTQDIPMKRVIYQSIVDTFSLQGIQPTLISVEHLDAPFYK